jgi:YfiH family protein
MQRGSLVAVDGRLCVPSWQSLNHGFFGRDQSLIGAGAKTVAGLPLVLVKQVHGDDILDLRGVKTPPASNSSTADGIIFSLDSRGFGVGVKTADCLPIILLGRESGAVVHAGWRGLACGIIEKAAKLIGEVREAAIGPAAGVCHYEVGPEVVTQVPCAQIVPGQVAGKFMLNLAETAVAQLIRACPEISAIHVASECTMHDPLFYSARRDGIESGRNLSLVWFL